MAKSTNLKIFVHSHRKMRIYGDENSRGICPADGMQKNMANWAVCGSKYYYNFPKNGEGLYRNTNPHKKARLRRAIKTRSREQGKKQCNQF